MMKQEVKRENIEPETGAGEMKTSVRKRILGWLGYAAVLAAILFFFAPESWWQFGVSPLSERKIAADFTLENINGGEWRFGEHRGKIVVVNYWATWCPPCRVETPGLVNFDNEYAARGVETIGVTVDENLADVPPFAGKYQIKYPILLAGHNPNVPQNGMPLPTTFLYDKYGRLAKKYTGIVLESTLKSDVERLLAENGQ